MKKAFLMVLLAALLLCFSAAGETMDFTPAQFDAYEAVKWNVDFPKNAQILQAMEYFCKAEGHPLRLMLLELTQNEHIENLFGNAARLLLIDLETGESITYANFTFPEGSSAPSKQETLHILFNHFVSYVEGYNPQIYADHELIFPLTPEEISAVNAALSQHFMP